MPDHAETCITVSCERRVLPEGASGIPRSCYDRHWSLIDSCLRSRLRTIGYDGQGFPHVPLHKSPRPSARCGALPSRGRVWPARSRRRTGDRVHRRAPGSRGRFGHARADRRARRRRAPRPADCVVREEWRRRLVGAAADGGAVHSIEADSTWKTRTHLGHGVRGVAGSIRIPPAAHDRGAAEAWRGRHRRRHRQGDRRARGFTAEGPLVQRIRMGSAADAERSRGHERLRSRQRVDGRRWRAASEAETT